MKYKVGDKVRIKSLDWYYDNRDRIDEVACGNTNFIPDMVKYCEEIITISSVLPTLKVYHIKEDSGMFNWTDEMIEGLVEEETLIEKVDDNGLPFNEWLSHKGAFHVPEDYVLKDENGNVINATKIVLEKKKSKYPTNYVECYEIMYGKKSPFHSPQVVKNIGYKGELFTNLQRLIFYRDAYWKIAGEEMGLGKPWEPDWESLDPQYIILYQYGSIDKAETHGEGNYILTFPTEEMRDAFYENFKELIEECKELL